MYETFLNGTNREIYIVIPWNFLLAYLNELKQSFQNHFRHNSSTFKQTGVHQRRGTESSDFY